MTTTKMQISQCLHSTILLVHVCVCVCVCVCGDCDVVTANTLGLGLPHVPSGRELKPRYLSFLATSSN